MAKLTFLMLSAAVLMVHSASILDYLTWDGAKKLIDLPELRNDQSNKNCMCKGAACMCCVDFNITFVDLGGPGCVHMKYLSPEDGFSVNVSYGKSLIHSSKIQGSNPPPICLEVFGKFAQVCAKFSDLAPTSDGLRGCLELEPKLLGESQLEFPIGCFKSNAGTMEMEDPPEDEEEEEAEGEQGSANGEEDKDKFDVESFVTNIYQTAEQGVAFFSSLLDLPNKLNATKPEVNSTEKPDDSTAASQRAPKNLKHPNQL